MTTDQESAALTKYDLYYESRLSKLETISAQLIETTKEIKTDIRWMFGITLGFYSITLMIIARGFHWIGG